MAKGRFHDIVAASDEFASFNKSFYVDLSKWKAFRASVALTWQRTRFEKSNLSGIPKERGVYAFTLLLESDDLPIHGYILYMGITGDDSGSELNKRYSQYLADARYMSKRPKVCAMLDKWSGDLFFNFAPVPDRRVSLRKIESSFLSAIVPPVNESDINGAVSAARKAAW